MKIGTKSILFGVHQFLIHPLIVAIAWWRLYGFPFDLRLWIAFFVHDLGYFGKSNMDDLEGEKHVELGARIMSIFDSKKLEERIWIGDGFSLGTEQIGKIFYNNGNYEKIIDCDAFTVKVKNCKWECFTLFHSRFYAKKANVMYSKLCVADKLTIAITPKWLYLIQANLTGEISEYMKGKAARTPAFERTQKQWLEDVQKYCLAWALEHKDCKKDLWTGTKRDLARS